MEQSPPDAKGRRRRRGGRRNRRGGSGAQGADDVDDDDEEEEGVGETDLADGVHSSLPASLLAVVSDSSSLPALPKDACFTYSSTDEPPHPNEVATLRAAFDVAHARIALLESEKAAALSRIAVLESEKAISIAAGSHVPPRWMSSGMLAPPGQLAPGLPLLPSHGNSLPLSPQPHLRSPPQSHVPSHPQSSVAVHPPSSPLSLRFGLPQSLGLDSGGLGLGPQLLGNGNQAGAALAFTALAPAVASAVAVAPAVVVAPPASFGVLDDRAKHLRVSEDALLCECESGATGKRALYRPPANSSLGGALAPRTLCTFSCLQLVAKHHFPKSHVPLSLPPLGMLAGKWAGARCAVYASPEAELPPAVHALYFEATQVGGPKSSQAPLLCFAPPPPGPNRSRRCPAFSDLATLLSSQRQPVRLSTLSSICTAS